MRERKFSVCVRRREMNVYDVLRALAEIELKRARVKNERSEALLELDEARSRLKLSQEKAEQGRVYAEALQCAVAQEEKFVVDERAKVAKKREALGSITGYKVQQVAESELEKVEAELAHKEDSILERMEEAENALRSAKVIEEALREAEALWKRLSGDISEAMNRFDDREAFLEQERQLLLAKLSDAQAALYVRTCERYPAQPVATLQRDVCGVCFVKIRPQIVVEVAKAESLQRCNGCLRILIGSQLDTV
jgi:uncharacterized protein